MTKTIEKVSGVSIYEYNDFYKKNKRALYQFIYMRCHDKLAAEELVNDAFIKAYKALSTFDGNKASFKTWIYNIAINATIDYLRKKQVSTTSMYGTDEEGEVTVMEFNSYEDSPLDEMIVNERHAQINQAMSKLDPAQANMLNKLVDGYSYEEIAEELRMPVGTVKATIHRSRQLMRALCTNKVAA